MGISPYELFVVVTSKQIADILSSAVFSEFPDVGPNNVNIPLVSSGGASDANPVAWSFNAPVTQEYVDWLSGLIKQQTDQVRSCVFWWRTDRSGILQKQYDNENPTPVLFTFDDALNKCGLKMRRVPVEI